MAKTKAPRVAKGGAKKGANPDARTPSYAGAIVGLGIAVAAAMYFTASLQEEQQQHHQHPDVELPERPVPKFADDGSACGIQVAEQFVRCTFTFSLFLPTAM
jgi:hypothetical protein